LIASTLDQFSPAAKAEVVATALKYFHVELTGQDLFQEGNVLLKELFLEGDGVGGHDG